MISGRKPSWTALDRQSLPGATAVSAGFRHAREVKLKVIGYEEIEVAVAVVVHERAAGAPTWHVAEQPGLFCNVSETTIAVVSVKFILAEVRYE